jgi:hypothetical protein
MSKKLDSILNTMPPATVSRMPIPQPKIVEKKVEVKVEPKTEERVGGQPVRPLAVQKLEAPKAEEKQDRIVAIIPYSLKREIKQYLVDHPGETEKTVLLKGLRALGFKVSEEHLEDLRGKKIVK